MFTLMQTYMHTLCNNKKVTKVTKVHHKLYLQKYKTLLYKIQPNDFF